MTATRILSFGPTFRVSPSSVAVAELVSVPAANVATAAPRDRSTKSRREILEMSSFINVSFGERSGEAWRGDLHRDSMSSVLMVVHVLRKTAEPGSVSPQKKRAD